MQPAVLHCYKDLHTFLELEGHCASGCWWHLRTKPPISIVRLTGKQLPEQRRADNIWQKPLRFRFYRSSLDDCYNEKQTLWRKAPKHFATGFFQLCSHSFRTLCILFFFFFLDLCSLLHNHVRQTVFRSIMSLKAWNAFLESATHQQQQKQSGFCLLTVSEVLSVTNIFIMFKMINNFTFLPVALRRQALFGAKAAHVFSGFEGDVWNVHLLFHLLSKEEVTSLNFLKMPSSWPLWTWN